MAGPRGTQDPLAELWRAIELVARQSPTDEIRTRFENYLRLLTAWNLTHHLTAYRTPRDIVRGLFIDSLLFLPLLPDPPRRLIDIGTGPGIPAVPLRIVEPELSVTLVDARHKPVSFLQALKRELDLPDLEVVHARAEDSPAGIYDCVVMRGVKTTARIAAAARGYVKPHGRIVIAAGPDASTAPNIPGSRVETVSFPEIKISRSFIVAGN